MRPSRRHAGAPPQAAAGEGRGPRLRRTPLRPPDNGVFESLRAWRKDEATRQSVPAYVIFPDRTLAEIALAKPRTIDELAAIHGVGASKLDRYGLDVLRVVREAA
ncbi:HRDC domain-containing protein [Roseomonas sp. CCTCC AB2023176]|uniref:HRDC domain-containing protein n=1 Tax=Roseomonas sp. CCTCC AB2023176 TaxID=3342640 RepID=UPI0035D54B29